MIPSNHPIIPTHLHNCPFPTDIPILPDSPTSRILALPYPELGAIKNLKKDFITIITVGHMGMMFMIITPVQLVPPQSLGIRKQLQETTPWGEKNGTSTSFSN